ncbi:MAG TPA: cytochrome P450 [Thermomicrobiales bacterium]|jgi:cytochrome P450
MDRPIDPIAAATALDPYPYYAELVAQRPFHRNESIGMWVATSADAVAAALQSEHCRVRPIAEPIPHHLIGSPVATVFQRFIRMNDRRERCPIKHAVMNTFAAIDRHAVAEAAAQAARLLTTEWSAAGSPEEITAFSFRLSTYTIAALLGFPVPEWPDIANWVGDFVRCLASSGDAPRLAAGVRAAEKLLGALHSALTEAQRQGSTTLLTALVGEAENQGYTDREMIVANALGFLMQAYEATAGLIGNTLVALAANAALCGRARADPNVIPAIVAEVLRHDSPVQNTRRFVAADCLVAGRQLRAGDTILVILAAANRDPLANPNPATFDLTRSARRSFTFGAGIHACPGAEIAAQIAAIGVAELLALSTKPSQLAAGHTYYPSANVRIPQFSAEPLTASVMSTAARVQGQR